MQAPPPAPPPASYCLCLCETRIRVGSQRIQELRLGVFGGRVVYFIMRTATFTFLLWVGWAHVAAQPAFQCGTGTAVVGSSGTVACNYLGTGSDVALIQIDVLIPSPFITVTRSECALGFSCGGRLPATNQPVPILYFDPGLNVASDATPAFQIRFDVSPDAPLGSVPVQILNELYISTEQQEVAPNGSVNGTIEVVEAPVLLSSGPVQTLPDPVGTLASATRVFTLRADSGTVDNIVCGLSGDPAIAVEGPVPSRLRNLEEAELTARCNSPTPGTFSATHTCTHLGLNSPTTTEITCNVSAVAPSPSPAPETELSLSFAPLDSRRVDSKEIVISNEADNASVFDVACEFIDDGGGVFSSPSLARTNISRVRPFQLQIQAAAAPTGPAVGRMICRYSNGTAGSFSISLSLARSVPSTGPFSLGLLALLILVLGLRTKRSQAT